MEPIDRSQDRLKRLPLVVVVLASLTATVFTFTRHRLGGNALSRFVTVERLVEAGTLCHDGTPLPSSVDAIEVDGKRYSSKPPLYSLIMAAEAAITRAVTGLGVFDHQRFYLALLVFLNQVLLYVLTLFVALGLVRQLTKDPWTQAITLTALSFASLGFGYSVTLNNHSPTACLLLLAFASVYGVRHRHYGAWHHGLAGLLAGLAASLEPTAGVFLPLFFGLLLLHNRRRALWFPVAALPPLAASAAGFYVVSGSFLPFYLQSDLYHYAGSYWLAPGGNDALSEPWWQYAFHSLVGHHGLFSLTPVFFLCVPTLCALALNRSFRLRWEYLAIAVGSFIIIAYILINTRNYGGIALGMRWFIGFMPLWVLAGVPIFERLRQRMRGRVLTYGLLLVSCIAVFEALSHSAFYVGGWYIGFSKVLGY